MSSVPGKASAPHALVSIRHFRDAHQDLLRITAPQRTGAAKRSLIDDGDLPSLRPERVGDRCAGRPGTDDEKIKWVVQPQPPSALSISGPLAV